ncbi:hypothetical protein ACFVRD_41265 [Streptomyces sp. NPDC057908]|uniref:hypothetical protein n=1 Tax=unclassified Streptomyces TaxID=2593676 RepID=UPI0036A9752E
MPEPTTRLAEIEARATAAKSDPFFVSDCEGELQVWRESALTHVTRDGSGEITSWSFPSCYRSTDQVIEIDLDSWDPGEDATDDQRRDDINALVTARDQDVPFLLTEIARLEADLKQIRHLHKDSPMGPCPVCFDGDDHVAGGDGLVPYPCPTARLAGATDCDPPTRAT